MEVILMENVDNLGEMGTTVTVARGYARNYLIPKGLAVLATDAHRKLVAEHMKIAAKRDDLRKAAAEELADEEDKLYGSVTARDIAEHLKSEHATFEHKQVVLDEAIKQLGVYSVPVKLHSAVEVMAKVWVVKG